MGLQICKPRWNSVLYSHSQILTLGIVALGNTGGLIGSNIYLAREAPGYKLGYGLSIGFIAAAAIAAIIMMVILDNINKRRAKQTAERGGEASVLEEEGAWNLAEMGDRSPLFKYVL